MAVKPNYIPRTLIGVGGVRLYNIPGVTYPDEMLHTKRGTSRSSGQPFRKVPAWGISTAAAAEMLGSSCSSARSVLHRHKVGFRRVAVEGAPPCLYWRREQVEALVKQREPAVRQCPKRMMDSETARSLLGVGRSTLYRYVRKKLLREYRVRLVTEKGARIKTYYLRAEVLKLAARIRAIRARERELRELLQQRATISQSEI